MVVWKLGAKSHGISLSRVHGTNCQPFDGFKSSVLVHLFVKSEQHELFTAKFQRSVTSKLSELSLDNQQSEYTPDLTVIIKNYYYKLGI